MKKITLLLAFVGLIFSTLVGQITSYPYFEDFENGPGGWSANNTINGSWGHGIPQASIINTAASGQNAWATNLSGSYNASEDSWVESPVFDFSQLANPMIQLNIWWESEAGWDGLVLQSSIDAGLTWQNVGVAGDPNNWFNSGNINSAPGGQAEGWSGDFGTGSGNWLNATHSLSALAGQSAVVFRLAFASDAIIQNDGVAFDDVSILELLCPQPTNLNASNITSVSADLSWVENGSASTWDIEIGPGGFVPTGTPSVQAFSNPFTMSSLTPSTAYDFYVRADCGGSNGTSSWSGPYSFTTLCTPFVAPFMDDVESHSPSTIISTSNCWTEESSGSYDWNVEGNGSTPSLETGPMSAHSGTNYFYVEASSGSLNDTAILVSPEIDLSALNIPAIEFYYHMYGSSMGNLFIDVYDGTWTSVDSILGEQQTSQIEPWYKKTIDISNYSGVIKIRFKAIRSISISGDISIDDIQVKELPTCFDPTNLSTNSITSLSANLSWVESGSATIWDIEHGPSGFVPTGTPTIVGTTTNPHTISGLNPSTAYDFYVRADCGGSNGTSDWSGPYTFTTQCASQTTPWIDSVEAHIPTTLLTASNCWEAFSNSGFDWNIEGNGSTPSSGTGPLGANSGVNYFYVEASQGLLNDTALLVSPTIDVSSLNAAGLEFYYHMFGFDMGDLYIDVFDGTSWTNNLDSIIGQQQINQADPWLLKSVDLSAFTNTVRVRFRALRGNGFRSDISIDDIAIVETNPCPQPTNLSATIINNNVVDVDWTENGNATTWEIEYDTTGFTPGTGTKVLTSTKPHSLTQLTGNTSYTYYIRSICGSADTSDRSGGIFNTTNVGIGQNASINNMKVFPNPTNGVLNVTMNAEDLEGVQLEVINATGQQVLVRNPIANDRKIAEKFDLSNHAKGMYFLKITSNKGTQVTRFFIQ